MTRRIRFIAAFGDENKTVELLQANGSGGMYQILIDKYWHGIIVDQLGGWRVVFQNPHPEFTQADLDIIIDMVKDLV